MLHATCMHAHSVKCNNAQGGWAVLKVGRGGWLGKSLLLAVVENVCHSPKRTLGPSGALALSPHHFFFLQLHMPCEFVTWVFTWWNLSFLCNITHRSLCIVCLRRLWWWDLHLFMAYKMTYHLLLKLRTGNLGASVTWTSTNLSLSLFTFLRYPENIISYQLQWWQ